MREALVARGLDAEQLVVVLSVKSVFPEIRGIG
jgi:hypothetical protein